MEVGASGILSTSQQTRSLDDFVLQGFLGSASSTDSSDTAQKRSSALLQMTPNTRKQKSTCVLWHSSEVNYNYFSWNHHSIAKLRGTSDGGLGSLRSPGLVHIQRCNLYNENITSLSQFPSKYSANQGRMNTARDFVLSTEHRLYIVQNKQQVDIGKLASLIEVTNVHYEQIKSRYHSKKLCGALLIILLQNISSTHAARLLETLPSSFKRSINTHQSTATYQCSIQKIIEIETKRHTRFRIVEITHDSS
ncbi:hypothetical protein MRB53_039856 [Persea americana]|nr:hypothetical protein MRB53_039856 [Persea americana]